MQNEKRELTIAFKVPSNGHYFIAVTPQLLNPTFMTELDSSTAAIFITSQHLTDVLPHLILKILSKRSARGKER